MITPNIIDAFIKYANAHNENPNSNNADTKFEEFYGFVSESHDEVKTEFVVDLLCRVDKEGKIITAKNIVDLFNSYDTI